MKITVVTAAVGAQAISFLQRFTFYFTENPFTLTILQRSKHYLSMLQRKRLGSERDNGKVSSVCTLITGRVSPGVIVYFMGACLRPIS